MIEINASSWSYVLLKYSDGMFEIIVKTTSTELSSEEQLSAAEILVEGILGEEKRMLTVAEINVVSEFEERFVNKGSNIKVLEEHINALG